MRAHTAHVAAQRKDTTKQQGGGGGQGHAHCLLAVEQRRLAGSPAPEAAADLKVLTKGDRAALRTLSVSAGWTRHSHCCALVSQTTAGLMTALLSCCCKQTHPASVPETLFIMSANTASGNIAHGSTLRSWSCQSSSSWQALLPHSVTGVKTPVLALSSSCRDC